MKKVLILASLCTVAMVAALSNAFLNGAGLTELETILSLPWGVTSLVDLYVGFTLFSAWILFREESRLIALIWVAGMMTLGFLTGAVYVLVAAWKSQGNWQRFWMGSRV